MELTHRQDEFRYISIMTKREIRKFLRIPDNFRILLNQGGATHQYTAVAKNLIGMKPHNKAMMIRSGLWSSQNYDEMSKFCNVIKVADLVEANGCTDIVPPEKWNIDPEASFFNFCSNETVDGI